MGGGEYVEDDDGILFFLGRSPCDVLACPVLAKLGACACRWQSLALAEPGAPYWPTPLNDCEANQMAALSGSP